MTQIKPLKNVWICVDAKGVPCLSTIRRWRKGSITELIFGTTWTWKEAKSYGWKCVKVNLEIEQV